VPLSEPYADTLTTTGGAAASPSLEGDTSAVSVPSPAAPPAIENAPLVAVPATVRTDAPAPPPAEIVVRTPAPAGRGGTFLSVVVIADAASTQVESDLAALDAALAQTFPVHEIVLVLTASRGRVLWARNLAEKQANLQVLGLLHEAGDEVAFTAGLDGALGDVVVTARLGADAPEDIVRCAGLVSDDHAVVVGVDSSAPSRRRLAVRATSALASRSMGAEIASVSLGLRAYSRAALDAWLPRRDRDRVLRMLPVISGYAATVMEYTPASRAAHQRGATSFRQVLRSIFYSSSRPLRFAVGLALVGSALNLLYALYVVAVGLFSGAVAGWTSMSLQNSIMFFLLSVVIAIMAEFMYQSNETANERPIYRVAFEATSAVLEARDMLNVESGTATATAAAA
jgi:polyisoprenyl-phosphate glycosyltransferase